MKGRAPTMLTKLTPADLEALSARIVKAIDAQHEPYRSQMRNLVAQGGEPFDMAPLGDTGRLLVTIGGIPLLDVDPADLRPRHH